MSVWRIPPGFQKGTDVITVMVTDERMRAVAAFFRQRGYLVEEIVPTTQADGTP